MSCRDCPYNKKEDEAEVNYRCDKIGGITEWYGQCEESADIIPSRNVSKRRKRNKRERDLKYKRHLKLLARNFKKYGSPVIYNDEIYVWRKGYYIKYPKPYYKRYYRGSNHRATSRYKLYKKISNRKVRRYRRELHNGSQYKKVFDYWWSVD